MKQKLDNPLDVLFDIDTTEPQELIEYEQTTQEVVNQANPVEKDDEDKEIDSKIDTVYDAALGAFRDQMSYTEIIEPRYAARNAEVASTYLNIALNAVATRAKVKGDRKRNSTFIPYQNGGKTTNNVIVASREDVLRMINVDGEDTKLK